MTDDDITTAVSPGSVPFRQAPADEVAAKFGSVNPEAGTTYTDVGTGQQYRYDGLRWYELTPEPQSTTETADPTAPQPECITCHGGNAPDVQEAVKRLRGFLVGDTASSPVATDMLTVLNALEKHHQ